MSKKKNGRSHGENGSKKMPTGDYAVGYCRPPKKHQFPKGTSGNPEGGRRRTRALEDVFDGIFRRRTTIMTPKGEQRVQVIEALGLAACKEALGGNVPMMKVLLDINDRITAAKASGVRFSEGDLALVEDFERRIAADLRAQDEGGNDRHHGDNDGGIDDDVKQ